MDRSKISHQPGVYLFKNSRGEIIYVGKAISLFNRVSSYFSGTPDSPKTAALVAEIRSLETIVVESEIEALILEANLIKKFKPIFNIRLTDDKDYLYIKITDEAYPKILTARIQELSGVKDYFGPFPSSKVVKETLKKLRRVFPWCSKPPRSDVRPGRPCFYYHLGLCPGPCAGKITTGEYRKNISRFRKFMQGKVTELFGNLTSEMEEYSKLQQFEEASRVKRTLTGISYLIQTNNVANYLENPNFLEQQNEKSLEDLQASLRLKELPSRIECFDISNLGGQFAVGSLVVLTDGEIDKKWYRRFKIRISGKPNDFAMMAEVLRRRVMHNEWPKPQLILIDGGKGQVSAALKELQLANYNVPVFGLAKRMEILIAADLSAVKLSRSSLSLKLLQKIRDEAHRFALNYHHRLRQNSYLANLPISV